MALRDIIGQPAAVTCLTRLAERGRVPHALLFHGPDGCGKRTTALALAAAVNCTDGAAGDACGVCAVCGRIAKGIEVDVRTFEPTRNEFRREQAAQLRDEAFLSPNASKKKFLILDAAHHITPEAANLLLKVLEEPPDTTIFILLTDNPHLMLPTIKSRSMQIPFRPLSEPEADQALGGDVTGDKLKLLYAVSGGNLSRIRKLADEPGMDTLFDEIKKFTMGTILNPAAILPPTSTAEKLQALAERIKVGTSDDTPASRRRKGVIAVLETILSLLETVLYEAAAGSPAPADERTLCEIMKNVIDTIRIIEGSGLQLLALETFFINLPRPAAVH